MKKAVVTGGAGFIGGHLVAELLRQGQEVTVLDRIPLSDAHALDGVRTHPGLRYVAGDIRDTKTIASVVTASTDVVYHLASVVGVINYVEDPLGLIDTTVNGTKNILDRADEVGVRLLYASTSEIYGKNPKVPWSEDDDRVLGSPTIDRWSYSTSKALCEHMVHAMTRHRDLQASVVRFFNVYGPGQSPQFVVGRSIHRVLNGLRPQLFDGGDSTRCFTYVADAVQGAIAAATDPTAIGEAFNIGRNVENTMRQVVDVIIAACGTSLEAEVVTGKGQYGASYEDIPRRIPAVDKARRVLGWQAETPVDEGVRRFVEWAKPRKWWLA